MSPNRKISVALISSAVLLGILGWLLPLPSNLKLNREIFWVTKTFTPKKYNVIIAGDSRAYRGVSPEDVTVVLEPNLTALNLGYSSGGFDRAYRSFILSKLEMRGNHKAIVLGITPHSLTPDALENGHFHEILATSKFDQLKTIYLSPISRFFEPRQFTSIKKIFKRSTKSHFERFHSNGWAESDNLKTDSLAAISNYSKVFDNNIIDSSAINDFMNWIDSLSQENIKVIGFRPPSTMQMRSLEDSLSGYNETSIKSLFEAHGGHWLIIKDADYETYDGSHLRPADARRLSKKIGFTLKAITEEALP
ncbi:hypothetical protein N9545_07175 [Salibacteraceae bacterium]|nr:hypothetical protein [Salibacteraceae bacterium]MDB9708961.1 hypothetical protein [Salibacteraceae bacterium]